MKKIRRNFRLTPTADSQLRELAGQEGQDDTAMVEQLIRAEHARRLAGAAELEARQLRQASRGENGDLVKIPF